VGAWYTIGLTVGIGVGLGVALAGALAASRAGRLAATLLGAAAGALVGLAFGWEQVVGGAAGGPLGAFGAAWLVRGTLAGGGTRGGTALLVGLAGLALGGLALIPAAGYVEAVAVPLLAVRLRRRAGERYAGLRILARD